MCWDWIPILISYCDIFRHKYGLILNNRNSGTKRFRCRTHMQLCYTAVAFTEDYKQIKAVKDCSVLSIDVQEIKSRAK